MGAVPLVVLFIAGCTGAPSINVLGAYFPGWMFCLVAGVVLTVGIRSLLVRKHWGDRIGPAAVAWPALVTAISLVTWLLFFQH
jgi:hypothetical protein